jgi:hypothetical protein
MYQPLPPITEDLAILEDQLRRERDPKRKPRLHLLVLLKSGQVTSRGQAAAHLALHRNTVAAWLRRYRDGGLEALLTYKEAGRPARRPSHQPCSSSSKRAWRRPQALRVILMSNAGSVRSLPWRCPIKPSMVLCITNSRPS